MKILDVIEIDLRSRQDTVKTVYLDIWDNSLSQKWLHALNNIVQKQYHLEKNYCFMGFSSGERNGELILREINRSISAINQANLGYEIHDHFDIGNSIIGTPEEPFHREHFNNLHKYFEDLQGVSGSLSPYYKKADAHTRWHIRQLNLLCHEFECWAQSYCKEFTAPEWRRPSQLMCWLNAPRFFLDEQDLELFGIETLNRALGGIYVGVNKAVGKHHWEVFRDEGRDSRVSELTTSTMRTQTEACGDFDIEWANNPGEYIWQKRQLIEFREWLVSNGFDPEDKALTIGHPQVGQVDLVRSFGTEDYRNIWSQLNTHLDVFEVRTSTATARYHYRWDDADYIDQQVAIIKQGSQS